ncbi:unnamed protein product [Ranitomeya imitator]|uniref:PPIase cyclophilin-type domain-containing protein n=1 Tax=Ranitomeya imitator TaxID=111125 RepID=A0ABN9MI97_9NEOB|nr:unnamed protein product [Ranitomeya imitator]
MLNWVHVIGYTPVTSKAASATFHCAVSSTGLVATSVTITEPSNLRVWEAGRGKIPESKSKVRCSSGYENFILKHDRAFLLSMANRGKHTNGSQFFIIHVVFGLVISGFEVIEQIENLKTDAASRPYADVRVIDCGIVGSKSTKDEKIKTPISESAKSCSSSKSSSSSESSSSESEAEVERSKKRKQKRKTRAKRVKRRRKEGRRDAKEEKPQGRSSSHERNSTTEDKDSSAKRDKPVVRPEEIPPIPENRFLLRKDAPINNPEPEQKTSPAIPETNEQNKGSITKSGRKIRGRGTIRYHTPPRSRSRSESSGDRESSETPPHWKEEMQRLKSYKPPTGEKWSKGDKFFKVATFCFDG